VESIPTRRTSAWRGSTVALLIAGSSACLAQEEAIPTVVVTGSRIRAEAGETTGPVTIVTDAELTRGGNDSLGKVLQTLPYNTGAPLNTNVNSGGDGSTRVDLRGLGPNRTVVLMNGRRLPAGGVGADSSIDVDAFPLGMIERVEVLTTGASAVYGADAIGGVINIVTRPEFDGFELGVQRSETSRGDGAITRAEALVGGELGSGRWMIGADYTDQQAVLMDARAYSEIPLTHVDSTGELIPWGSPAIADGRYLVPGGNTLGLEEGLYTRVAGSTGQSASDWRPIGFGAEPFNFAPFSYLQTLNERGSIWFTGNHPLQGAEIFVEGLLSRRESAQKLAPAPVNFRPGQAPPLESGGFGVPAVNFYNPFGMDIAGCCRRLVELDDRGFGQRVEMWRVLAGVRGELHAWTWEVSAAMSDSDAVTNERGLPLSARFRQGLGPSGRDMSGNVVCGVPDPQTGIVPASAVIAGCVPINLFGGAGSITQEQLDYMADPIRDTGHNTQRLANAGFEGPWGRTPAGEIRWALGAEYRYESGAYVYDEIRAGGTVSSGLASDIPGGEFEALEGYAEARIPLLADGERWGEMNASLGARFSDFDTFGSHTSWHAGWRWDVNSTWALRADYATLFRAPALAELYETQVLSDEDQAFDPCGNDPTPEQQSHCAANGVPGGSYVQEEFVTNQVTYGGNPALEPEDGHSFDAGIELHSGNAGSWRLSLDYFESKLAGYIERPESGLLLDECANFGTPTACSKITRFADGSLESVDNRISNFGLVKVSGIDFAGNVGVTSGIGNIDARVIVTNLLSHELQPFEGTRTIDRLGRANFRDALPQWRGLGSLGWSREAWGAQYTVQWIGGFTQCTFAFDDSEYCVQVPSVLYHDFEVSYRWQGLQVQAGVDNLADKDPPYINLGEGNTNTALYRLLGRTWFLRLAYTVE